MATWKTENVHVTVGGQSLINRISTGDGKILITRVASSDQFFDGQEPANASHLVREQQNFTGFRWYEAPPSDSRAGYVFEAQLDNTVPLISGADNLNGYPLKQIGVFAKYVDKDGNVSSTEVLMFFAEPLHTETNPDIVPSKEHPVLMSYSLQLDFFSNTEALKSKVEVVVNEAGILTKAQYLRYLDEDHNRLNTDSKESYSGAINEVKATADDAQRRLVILEGDALRHKGVLKSSDNVDEFRSYNHIGIWYSNGSNFPSTGLPLERKAGENIILLVWGSKVNTAQTWNYIQEVYYPVQNVKYRRYWGYSDDWTTWKYSAEFTAETAPVWRTLATKFTGEKVPIVLDGGEIIESDIFLKITGRLLEADPKALFEYSTTNMGDKRNVFKHYTDRDFSNWYDLDSSKKSIALVEGNYTPEGIKPTSNNAVKFNNGSYLPFTNKTDVSFTVSFIAKVSHDTKQVTYFSHGNSAKFYIQRNGSAGFRFITTGENYYDVGYFNSDNYSNFVHYAMVYDIAEKKVKWYRNGELSQERDITVINIKAQGGYNTQLISGSDVNDVLQYMVVYAEALTAEQIRKEYEVKLKAHSLMSQEDKLYDLDKRLDETNQSLKDHVDDTDAHSVEFAEATTRSNLTSGEKLSVLFGKIKKWFSDLHKVAFSGKYTDLIDTPTNATQSTAGFLSASDKKKLDSIEEGSQKNTVTGIKGADESTYRTGDVNITKSNIGLGNVPNVTTDNQTPTVTTASSRTNLSNGDTLKTIIGKISKFFADLKTVAFSGNYNDLSGRPSNASTSTDGFMSKEDKSKLNDIEEGAQKNTVTGVKGGNESDYRTGNINITKDNVGLGDVPNVSTNNQTPTFTQATSRANIVSGEKLSVIMGKIMRFFADLKAVAFSGSYSDLSDKPTTATTSKDGFMSSADKTKLNGIDEGATKIRVKGSAESNYRTGDVNITPESIGLGNVPNVSTNDQTPTFTQASSRANIVSGEKLSTILGKLMKWFTDLKTVAFSGSYSDLSNKPSNATTSSAGFMSPEDKTKLNGIAEGAQKNDVTGVKGSNESTYRKGNVSISKEDVGLGDVPNVTTDNQTPSFTQASSRVNIASKENLSTLFGKIMKWFADLKSVAFSGNYSDLTNKPTSMQNPYYIYGYKNGTYHSYNGSASKDMGSIYAPESAGTAGYIPISTGGIPQWVNKDSFAVCSTAGSTKEKVVSIPYIQVATGTIIRVKFTYACAFSSSSGASPSYCATLNVNGTGSKPIIIRDGDIIRYIDSTVSWKAGDILTLQYDGSNWVIIASLYNYQATQEAMVVIGLTTTPGHCDFRCDNLSSHPDHSAVFQQALDELKTRIARLDNGYLSFKRGGTLLVKAGTYYINNSISLWHDTTFAGTSPMTCSVTIKGEGRDTSVLYVNSHRFINRFDEIVFKDIRIDGKQIRDDANTDFMTDGYVMRFYNCQVSIATSTLDGCMVRLSGSREIATPSAEGSSTLGCYGLFTAESTLFRISKGTNSGTCYSGIVCDTVQVDNCEIELMNKTNTNGYDVNFIYEARSGGHITNSIIYCSGRTSIGCTSVSLKDNEIWLMNANSRIHHYDTDLSEVGSIFTGNTVYCNTYVYLRASVISGNRFNKLPSLSTTATMYLYLSCPSTIVSNVFNCGTGTWYINCSYKINCQMNISYGTLSKSNNVPTASLFANNLRVDV